LFSIFINNYQIRIIIELFNQTSLALLLEKVVYKYIQRKKIIFTFTQSYLEFYCDYNSIFVNYIDECIQYLFCALHRSLFIYYSTTFWQTKLV